MLCFGFWCFETVSHSEVQIGFEFAAILPSAGITVVSYHTWPCPAFEKEKEKDKESFSTLMFMFIFALLFYLCGKIHCCPHL